MSQLSSLIGQHEHYSSVRDRLYGPSRSSLISRANIPPATTERKEAPAPKSHKAKDPQRPQAPWNKPYADMIIAEVAAKHGLIPEQLAGNIRVIYFRRARVEAFHRLYTELGYSSAMIALLFNRNSSTVLRAINRYIRNMEAA